MADDSYFLLGNNEVTKRPCYPFCCFMTILSNPKTYICNKRQFGKFLLSIIYLIICIIATVLLVNSYLHNHIDPGNVGTVISVIVAVWFISLLVCIMIYHMFNLCLDNSCECMYNSCTDCCSYHTNSMCLCCKDFNICCINCCFDKCNKCIIDVQCCDQ